MNTAMIPQNVSDEQPKFEFEGQEIRAFVGANGEPLFAASDVCEALSLSNVSQAVSRLDDDEKTDIISNDVVGRPNKLIVINEAGLYSLVLRSDKAEAKRFRKWITSEVLPSIRKHGMYAMQQRMSPAEMLVAQAKVLLDHERQLTSHQEILEHHGEIIGDFGQRIRRLESEHEAAADGVNYFTVKGYCSYMKLPSPTEAEARSIGKRATTLSHTRSVKIENVPDPTWGTVHRYHRDILREVLNV